MMINSSSGTCNFFCKKSVKCTSAVSKQRANKRQKHAFEILEDNVGLVKQLPKRNYPEKKRQLEIKLRFVLATIEKREKNQSVMDLFTCYVNRM